MPLAGRVGVVLRQRAVADHEQLDVLEQAGVGPEALPLVAVDLVERLPDVDTAALELDVHHRQAVDEHGHVVAVRRGRPVDLVLVDDLEPVVVDVGLVDQVDVLGRAVVALEDLDVVFLDAGGLLDDPVVLARDRLVEEPLPLGVGELDLVQRFELGAQVGLQRGALVIGRYS